MQIVDYIGNFLRSNLMYVAIGIVATTLTVFGIHIQRALKNLTKNMNFLIRFAIYVFVFAFGIGFLSAPTVKFMAGQLGGLSNLHLVLAVVVVFLLLCVSAKSQRQI